MRAFFLVILYFTGSLVYAQNKQLLYNVPSLPQNLMSNPGGTVEFDLHVGTPLFSQVSFFAGSSGVSMYDILGEEAGTINQKIDKALGKMTDRDFFGVREQVELLSFGWRDQAENYFSAGIYQEADVFAYFPKDIAVLAWEGNEEQKNFHLSDLAFTAEVLNVFHIGIMHPISEDLFLGVRGKLYSGMLNVRSVNNEGDFFTYGGADGELSRPNLRNVDILIRTAGLDPFLGEDKMTSPELVNHFINQGFFGGNLGVGVDVGFTYYFSDQYKFTGSLLDIGMIKNSQDVKSFRYHGNYNSGDDQESPMDPDHPDKGELGEFFHEEQLSDPYISTRPVKLNASIDYGFGEELGGGSCLDPAKRRRYRNHLGFQLFSMKRPRGLVHAATLSFDTRLSDSLFGKITYTADSFSYSNLGLLLSGRISSLNVYLAADNLLDYTNLAKARNASVQLGVQFIFNR